MADRPTADELIVAVREFLERDVMPVVDGRTAFHLRVAMNVLNIVERELTVGEAVADQERNRLITIVGHDGDLESLRREAATQIRTGALDDRFDEILGLLTETARDSLAVNNPKYLG
jgi:adenosine/AMP kinase